MTESTIDPNRCWTPERQLCFLNALGRGRSVTSAAAAVGMSRESAYRLRARPGNALFAMLWKMMMRGSRTGQLAAGPAESAGGRKLAPHGQLCDPARPRQ